MAFASKLESYHCAFNLNDISEENYRRFYNMKYFFYQYQRNTILLITITKVSYP